MTYIPEGCSPNGGVGAAGRLHTTHAHKHAHARTFIFSARLELLFSLCLTPTSFLMTKKTKDFEIHCRAQREVELRGLWGKSWPTPNFLLRFGTQQFTVGERVACQRALCDWAKREEYVQFKMKRQPFLLKAELLAHGAWEKETSQRKALICKLVSLQQMLPGPLAKGIPGHRPLH